MSADTPQVPMAEALPYLRAGLALLARMADSTPEQVRLFWEDQTPEPQGDHRPGLARLYLQLMDVRMQVDHLVFDVFDRLAKERYVLQGSARVADAVRADPRDSVEMRAFVEATYPLATPYEDAPAFRKRVQAAERDLMRARQKLSEAMAATEAERGRLATEQQALRTERAALQRQWDDLTDAGASVTARGVHPNLLATLRR